MVENSSGYRHNCYGIAAFVVAIGALVLLALAENEEVEDLEDSCGVQNKQHHEPGHRLQRASAIEGEALPD